MHVRHLSVADFRSWPAADVAFEPGPAVLIGSNGQGKTNLVEALGYVATLGSHRVSSDAPLVRQRGRAGGRSGGGRRRCPRDARRARDRARAREPGQAERLARSAARARCWGSCASSSSRRRTSAIVRGDPTERRRFLDDLVVARAPRLAGVRADYERVLKQRAALLKSAARGPARRATSARSTSGTGIWPSTGRSCCGPDWPRCGRCARSRRPRMPRSLRPARR